MHDLAGALRDALADGPACLVRLPLGWSGGDLEVGHLLATAARRGQCVLVDVRVRPDDYATLSG
jgi:hypothetical protein